MLKKRESSSRRVSTEINAGSMADIAFLLLIFFLVTTTIEVDKGILVRLPPWSEEPPETAKLNKRNVLSVLVNANNQLLVRGEEMDVNNLKEKVIEFITNPQMKENYPLSPKEAIVSLQNDRGTEYNTYIQVYNELKAAYNQLRDDEAESRFGTLFDNLNRDQKKQIIDKYPMKLSEADPTEFGEETQ
jgi:biopolymer transport protein ExbD